jgi:hypothetical protein
LPKAEVGERPNAGVAVDPKAGVGDPSAGVGLELNAGVD